MRKLNPARRKLIKALAGVGAAAVVMRELPERWTRPLLDHVLLPAHATTSVTGVYATTGQSVTDAGHSPLDLLVAPAYAGTPSAATVDIYADIVNGVASVQVLFYDITCIANGFYFTGSGIQVGAASATTLTWQNTGTCSDASATIVIDNVTNTANGTVTLSSSNTGSRSQPFNLTLSGSPISNPGDCGGSC